MVESFSKGISKFENRQKPMLGKFLDRNNAHKKCFIVKGYLLDVGLWTYHSLSNALFSSLIFSSFETHSLWILLFNFYPTNSTIRSFSSENMWNDYPLLLQDLIERLIIFYVQKCLSALKWCTNVWKCLWTLNLGETP